MQEKISSYKINNSEGVLNLNSNINIVAKNTKCTSYFSYGKWIEECTTSPFRFDIKEHAVPLVTISSILFFLIVIVLEAKKEGKPKNPKDNSIHQKNFDLISFIEELKEDQYPDASIGESFVKGSYVILKDLNGKTIAEIKLSELNKSPQYSKKEDETLILNDEISSDEKNSYPKFWEFWRRDYWEEKDED